MFQLVCSLTYSNHCNLGLDIRMNILDCAFDMFLLLNGRLEKGLEHVHAWFVLNLYCVLGFIVFFCLGKCWARFSLA